MATMVMITTIAGMATITLSMGAVTMGTVMDMITGMAMGIITTITPWPTRTGDG